MFLLRYVTILIDMDDKLLENLLDISRQLAETRELKPLLEVALQTALDTFNAERGYLILLDENGEADYRLRRTRDGAEIEKPEADVSQTILQQVIHSQQDLVTADALSDPGLSDASSVHMLRIRSVICVPLIARQRSIGALYMENRSMPAIFTNQDLKPLKLFASQAAIAIENAALNDDLEERVAARTAALQHEIEERKLLQAALEVMARTDQLTGISNRRHFFEVGQSELIRARRYHHPLSLIMFDCDHFKQINDTFGHLAGDEALREITRRICAELRSSDVFARYGGEEFVILLVETSLAKARQVAERLRQAIASEAMHYAAHSFPVTISLGLAAFDSKSDASLDKLLEQVDLALYAAKQAGRNQVQIYTSPSPDWS